MIRGADGVPTAVWVDENRDGITERLSRVDGASDAVEELRDTDGDGVPDRRLTFGAGVEPIAGAGDEVTVTIQHTGSMPKTSMGHSFVLLAQGVEMADFGAAASRRRTATTSRPIGRPT
ncbi:MAG TPA: hypothetical protein RMH99_24320 [Sandaracinaceae bacterium LLY-WYZ-13_1]|nr:hypothetical protein [Sandaracinaceae bacterium LLY-WYZ-13_1]